MVSVRKCSSNDYGTLYELYPAIRHTLKHATLPNGLETHYDKKHLNWTCSDDDVDKLYGALSDASPRIYQCILRDVDDRDSDSGSYSHNQPNIDLRPGIREGTPSIIETQTYPRITSHKLFEHEQGELMTFGSLTAGFTASTVSIECKHIWVNKQMTSAKAIWYTSRVRPMR
jgi:hypothetical protein